MRKDELCNIALCHESPGHGVRCSRCPLTRLEAAQCSAVGQILQRALHKRALVKMGIPLSLDDIDAGELYAMMIIEEEQRLYEDEKVANNGRQ